MATRMVARKCPICGGTLTYDKTTKLWTCLYCGAISEREFQYDGLYTVNNAVRQALKEVSKGRMEDAARHYSEAEMIDYDYVGTIIAGLTYEMIAATASSGETEREIRNHITAVREYYERLRDKGQTISEDEEALYEILEDSDVYATLLLVFDSLGDAARRDYVENLINPERIYTESINNKLLSYAMKHCKFDLVDKQLDNSNNLDTRYVLGILLNNYPDGEGKCVAVQKIAKQIAPRYEDKIVLENYLVESKDLIHTKAQIVATLMDVDLKADLNKLVEFVLYQANTDDQKSLIAAICRRKLADEDVEILVNFGVNSNSYEIAQVVLNCLRESNHFVYIPTACIIAVLHNRGFGLQDKMNLVRSLYDFKTKDKVEETVLTEYLCNIPADLEERRELLKYLLSTVHAIPTKTVENYVINCSLDNDAKPEIIELLFEKGLTLSFFNDLLSSYINSSSDQQNVKQAVINKLVQKGLKLNADALFNYICYANASGFEKIDFLNKLLINGAQIRTDTANHYLENVSDQQFHSELFTMLLNHAASFSGNAIVRYLMILNDRQEKKAEVFKTIADRSDVSLSGLSCDVIHQGNSVTCNILHAYLLKTADSSYVVKQIAEYMISDYKIRMNDDITVAGARVRLKKYLANYRNCLNPAADEVFENHKVYSMFF